ncbi:MAG: pyridoxamine 5'-phosphate oxidase family protein [Dehalococcoidia bacterium]
MATWGEFAQAEPEMAALGLRLLHKFELAYLATTRRDGSARLHPVCPVIAGGRVFVATDPASPKRFDLLRDGRYALHMLPGEHDAEFWIRGRARRTTDHETRAMVVDTAARTVLPGGGTLVIRDVEWLFEYDLQEAGTAVWENVGTPEIRALRRFWRAP